MDVVDTFVLRVVKDSLLIVDEKGCRFANKAFEDLCDYTSTQILSEPSLLMKDKEREEFFLLVKKLISDKRTFNEAVVECHNKHSGPFISKVVFHPFRDSYDSELKCVCIFTDPLFYKPLFDNIEAPLGLIEFSQLSRECHILKANHVATTLFGIEESEVTSTPLSRSHYGFEFSEEQFMLFSKSRSCSSPLITQLKLVSLNNNSNNNKEEEESTLWLSATVAYIGRSLQGRSIFSFVGKEVIKASERENGEGEGRGRGRGEGGIGDLDNIESSASFLAKMVHELRSPLSGLLGMSSMLKATGMTTEQRDYMKTIEACGDSMSGLISNLLDLSCLERNRVILTNQPFDVVQCIEEALDIGRVNTKEKSFFLPSLCDLSLPQHPFAILLYLDNKSLFIFSTMS
jgi:hypothetical protein